MVDTSNYLSCGYLAPDGVFYSCTSFGHLKLAERLCHKHGYTDTLHKLGVNINALTYETYLLCLGYVCIRNQEVEHICTQGSINIDDMNIPVMQLTDAQRNFLASKLDKCQNLEQYDSIMSLLEIATFKGG